MSTGLVRIQMQIHLPLTPSNKHQHNKQLFYPLSLIECFLCEWPRFFIRFPVVSCDLESISKSMSQCCKRLLMPRQWVTRGSRGGGGGGVFATTASSHRVVGVCVATGGFWVHSSSSYWLTLLWLHTEESRCPACFLYPWINSRYPPLSQPLCLSDQRQTKHIRTKKLSQLVFFL